MNEQDIDVWYPKLRKWTFESAFIPLQRKEAESIKAFHDVSWRNCRPNLAVGEIETLNELENFIDAVIRDRFNNKPVFMRLCGRSPKDGEPLDRQAVIANYNSTLAELIASGHELTANTRMIAISRVSWLKVSSGADTMSLLLSSERVFAEMLDWLRYGEPEQICLREWEPDLKLEYEFRAFICRGRLTAISQYDHYTHFPELVARRSFFKTGIISFWKDIHPHVCELDSSYVLDVAYLPSTNSFVLVEMSPFTPCTGPALFHWEIDKAVLSLGATASQHENTCGTRLCNEDTALSSSSAPDIPYDCRQWQDLLESQVELRLKELSDVHPQLGEIIDVNWDMRWAEEKVPYHSYLHPPDAAGAGESSDQQAEAEAEASGGGGVLRGLFRWLTTPSTQPQQRAAETKIATSAISSPESPVTALLFVYGTLKKGFHWNSKYLAARLGAHCVGAATTVTRHALVIGDCGVPYLLGDVTDEDSPATCKGNDSGSAQAGDRDSGRECDSACDTRVRVRTSGGLQHVVGEVWRVSADCLSGLDEYEGVDKGYYSRSTVSVAMTLHNNDGAAEPAVGTVDCFVYTINTSTAELRQKPFISEYTLEDHLSLYQPVRHIQIKQFKYFKAPSTWGKTKAVIALDNEVALS